MTDDIIVKAATAAVLAIGFALAILGYAGEGRKVMKYLRCGFSHNYTKLYGQTAGRLLDVKRIHYDYIDELALIYDTTYRVPNPHGCELARYELKPGAYLRMTFIGNRGIPFTTYRTDTQEHREKYEGNVGKVFEIYVKDR